ncbi:MAG TPA: NAD(P)H-dependent oxidoreductase [Chitinophagaceae bacterium]|jgi:NAD(P)H-dependent FMN reductase|nr:NAD(P)H-dependent oxidoreductase [Chitinophagaceae bacterium]
MRIEIISGSARVNSTTFRLALHLQKRLAQSTEHEVNIIDCREHELPPLQEVFGSVERTPEQYRALSERVFAADAFILVTPEYNGSYTPAMKNLLDHFPKQQHKPFGIATASPGGLGGIRAAMQLQQLIYALFGIGSPFMLVTPGIDKKFDEEGNLLDLGFDKSIDQFIREYLWLAEKLVHEKEIA